MNYVFKNLWFLYGKAIWFQPFIPLTSVCPAHCEPWQVSSLLSRTFSTIKTPSSLSLAWHPECWRGLSSSSPGPRHCLPIHTRCCHWNRIESGEETARVPDVLGLNKYVAIVLFLSRWQIVTYKTINKVFLLARVYGEWWKKILISFAASIRSHCCFIWHLTSNKMNLEMSFFCASIIA